MRSSLERNFGCFDQGYRFEHHCICAQAKFKACATLATAVMMAMVLGHVRVGGQQQVRSLVKPVAVLDRGWLSDYQIVAIQAVSHTVMRIALV